MPDAPVKNTFFFEAPSLNVPTGWTETWWSFHASLDVAQTAAIKYAKARKELLGLGCYMQAWRGVLNPAGFTPPGPPKRVSQVYFFRGSEGLPTTYTSAVNDQFDPSHEDLLCRVQAKFTTGTPPVPIVKRRPGFLAGLPDSQTDQLKINGIDAAYVNSDVWKAWIASLVNTPYYVRYKTANGPPAVYTAAAITDVQSEQVRHRNRGRPFFLFRGRKLA